MDQDNRFANKEKKLLKSMKFDDILEEKVSACCCRELALGLGSASLLLCFHHFFLFGIPLLTFWCFLSNRR